MTALAGFLFASQGHIQLGLLLAAVGGTSLIVASAGAFNNYFDRDIDLNMERTQGRALVKGEVPAWMAIIYAALLGVAGFGVLGVFTNLPTIMTGIVGMLDYLVFYGISKRHSVYSTLIGSICGATPIVAGYTAVTGQFDPGALLLFLIMVFWQMPHFYAIGIYRLKDYRAAGLPIWPVKYGARNTKRQMLLYIILFIVANARLSLDGYAGKTYALVAMLLGLWWLYRAAQGYKVGDDVKWARNMFGISLIVLLGFSTMLALNAWLP